MSAFPLPRVARRMHAHLRLLLLLTLLVRGGMYLAYPLQVRVDDNQRAQRYLIDRLVEGDLLIGNVRYNTGYPFVIAPFAAAGQQLGRLGERLVLLVQVTFTALIPFLLYDLVRRHHSRRAALAVALLALFDPHGLQWAHLSLPVWLVALCFTLVIWLVDRAAQRGLPWRSLMLVGVILGIAVLARLNSAPVAALTGMFLLFSRGHSLRRRLTALLALVAGCLLIVGGYTLLVHFPSTGTFRLSCVGGRNAIESIQEAGIPVASENGNATARLLLLNALPADSSFEPRYGYDLWQRPGPWVSQEAQSNFREQPAPKELPGSFDIFAPRTLGWFLGPCELDSLYFGAALEALVAQPLKFLQSLPEEVFELLHRVTRWHLPHVDSLEIYEDSDVPFPLQRARSWQGGAYMRNPLWPTPLAIYSHTRDILDLTNLLIVPALVWALLRRRVVFGQAALTLILWVVFLAVIDWREGRLAASLWPLWPLLTGGMLADLWQWLRPLPGAGRGSDRPSR